MHCDGNHVFGQLATAVPQHFFLGDLRLVVADGNQLHSFACGVVGNPDRCRRDEPRQLHGRFRLPVFEVDERYSTTEALQEGARDADAAAACIILDQFFRSLK